MTSMTPQTTLKELEDLVDALVRNELDDAGIMRLNDILDGDPQMQRHYLGLMDLHNTLKWEISSRAMHEAFAQAKALNLVGANGQTEVSSEPAKPDVIGTISDQTRQKNQSIRWRELAMAAMAAMLLFGLSAAIILSLPEKTEVKTGPVTVIESPENPVKNLIPEKHEKHEKQDKQVDDGATILAPGLASITDQVGAVWGEMKPVSGQLIAGTYKLKEGLLRFDMQLCEKPLEGMKRLTIEAPASFELQEDALVLNEGMLVLDSRHSKSSRLRVVTPGGEFVERGAEVGVAVNSRGTRVTVFRGGVHAALTDRYIGMVQKKELTRDDQVYVTAVGEATFSINDDDVHFAAIRPAKPPQVALANHSFEYPPMPASTLLEHPLRAFQKSPIAAAGWSMVSHPLNNSEGRIQEGGLVRGRDFLNIEDDSQWIMLRARRNDGKVTHNSIHQKVGAVKQRVTYVVSLKVGHPVMGAIKEAEGRPYGGMESRLAVALYATDKDSPKMPTYMLHQWTDPVNLKRGESKAIKLKYRAPRHFSFRGQDLYLVIEALPGKKAGFSAVMVDDIRLKVLP